MILLHKYALTYAMLLPLLYWHLTRPSPGKCTCSQSNTTLLWPMAKSSRSKSPNTDLGIRWLWLDRLTQWGLCSILSFSHTWNTWPGRGTPLLKPFAHLLLIFSCKFRYQVVFGVIIPLIYYIFWPHLLRFAFGDSHLFLAKRLLKLLVLGGFFAIKSCAYHLIINFSILNDRLLIPSVQGEDHPVHQDQLLGC